MHKIIETRVDDWLDSVEDQLFNYSHDRNNIEWPRQYSRTVFAVLVDLPRGSFGTLQRVPVIIFSFDNRDTVDHLL